MKKKWLIIFVSIMTLSMLLVACGQKKDGEELEDAGLLSSNILQNEKLGSEPMLTLMDVFSSQSNYTELSSGNYSWNVENGFGQIQSAIACGVAPLEFAGMDIVTKIKLPGYNGTDGVTYSVSGGLGPDSLIVTRWDSSAIGDAEAQPLETQTYTYPNLLVELLPGSVYEFTAEWSKENLEAYGAYGEASFVLVTE